jgi:hypothetical protein
MGEYSIPAISESPIMDVFPYFSGEDGELEQLEKFIARKDSKPEIIKDSDFEDSMEFETVLEEDQQDA